MRSEQREVWEVVRPWFESGVISDGSASVDLLPVFYARFGPLLDVKLLAIQLTNSNHRWQLNVLREGGADDRFDVASLLRLEGEKRNVHEIIIRLLESCVEFEIADVLDIFNAPAMSLIASGEQAAVIKRDEAWESQQATVAFHLDCARFLAQHIADDLDLVAPTMAKLKSESATGILDGGEHSRWDEIVSQSRHIDSLLAEGFNDDIRSAAYEVFESWLRAKQLALWMTHSSTCDGIEDVGAYSPESGAEGFNLHDIQETFNDVVGEILGRAVDEADQRGES